MQKTISENRIKNLEHEITILSKAHGTEEQQIELYKKIQDEIASTIAQYRAMGLDDNHEMLQDLEEQWWDFSDKIKSINKDILDSQLKILENIKSDNEKAVSAVVNVIDKEIAALEEKKRALEGANEEREKAIELAQLEDNLQKARERTIRIYRKDIGFVYEQDLGEIQKAQEEIDKFKTQEQINEIDKEIDSWEKYKESWTEIPDIVQEEQDRLKAIQVLGADFEEQILNRRIDTLQKFAEEYKNILRSIESVSLEISSLERQSVSEDVPSSTLSDIGSTSISKSIKASNISSNLRSGDSGENVEILQSALETLGYSTGKDNVNGTFEDGTLNALKNFQSDNGIQMSGILDEETKEKFKLNGFKRGVSSVPKSQYAYVDESNKEEIIIRKNGSKIKWLEKGDSVIPFQKTNNLMQLANNPLEFISKNLFNNAVFKKNTQSPNISIGDIIISKSIGSAEDLATDIVNRFPNMMLQLSTAKF